MTTETQAVVNIVAAIGSLALLVGLVVCNILLWRATHKAAKAAEKSAQVAGDSARTMTEYIRLANLPVLEFRFRRADSVAGPGAAKKVVGDLQIINRGKGVAQLLAACHVRGKGRLDAYKMLRVNTLALGGEPFHFGDDGEWLRAGVRVRGRVYYADALGILYQQDFEWDARVSKITPLGSERLESLPKKIAQIVRTAKRLP